MSYGYDRNRPVTLFTVTSQKEAMGANRTKQRSGQRASQKLSPLHKVHRIHQSSLLFELRL